MDQYTEATAQEQQASNRVLRELKAAGMSTFGLWHAESHYLHHLIHPDEHIRAVAYGMQEGAFVLLAATDRRVLYIDKNMLAVNEDEVSYGCVQGITYNTGGVGATLVLHTKIGDYHLLTFNPQASQRFVEYIEQRCLDSREPAVTV